MNGQRRHSVYTSPPLKECNIAIWDNMNGPRGYYVKWNKLDRKRQVPYDFTYMWIVKYKTSEPTERKQTCRYREQTGGCQNRGGLGLEWNKWERLRGTKF